MKRKTFSYLLLSLFLLAILPHFSNATIPIVKSHPAITHNSNGIQSIDKIRGCPVWSANCKGQKKFIDGSVYTGEFRYGKPHGKGSMKWKDGSVYKGEFLNGERHGKGEFTFADGNKYEGEWTYGYMQGQGVFQWNNGNEYIGAFKEDKMNGEGSILFSNGESFAGNWKDGIADGFGTLNKMDGSKFSGDFKNGVKNGTGQIAWSSGDTLNGNWLAGNLDGNINFKFSNGDQMVSIWKNGDLSEEMIYQKEEGESFLGTIDDIYEDLAMEDVDLIMEFEENIQLSLYSIGTEYQSMNRFEEATAFLEKSQEFAPVNSPFNNIISNQLAEVKEMKESNGWAKIEDNETN